MHICFCRNFYFIINFYSNFSHFLFSFFSFLSKTLKNVLIFLSFSSFNDNERKFYFVLKTYSKRHKCTYIRWKYRYFKLYLSYNHQNFKTCKLIFTMNSFFPKIIIWKIKKIKILFFLKKFQSTMKI